MDVTPLIRPSQKIIQSYTKGRFKISGESFTTPVIVGPDFVRPWPLEGSDINAASLSDLSGNCDVLLIGTGGTIAFPNPDQRQTFRELGLKAEFMDTGAACRTFNVLSAEGRQVIAALLPV